MYFCTGFIILGQFDYLSEFAREFTPEAVQLIIDNHYSGAETRLTYQPETGMLTLTLFAYLSAKEDFEAKLNTLYAALLDLGYPHPFGVLYCHDPECFPNAMYALPINGMELNIKGLSMHMDPFFSPLSEKLGSQRLF